MHFNIVAQKEKRVRKAVLLLFFCNALLGRLHYYTVKKWHDKSHDKCFYVSLTNFNKFDWCKLTWLEKCDYFDKFQAAWVFFQCSNNRYHNCVLASLKGSTHHWGHSSHRPFLNQCKPNLYQCKSSTEPFFYMQNKALLDDALKWWIWAGRHIWEVVHNLEKRMCFIVIGEKSHCLHDANSLSIEVEGKGNNGNRWII